MEDIEFREEQKFTQWWLWLLLGGIGLLPVAGIYQQLILKKPFGNRPMSDSGLILFALFVFGLLALFWSMRLKTRIDRQGIRMNFFPFTGKQVGWNEVRKAEVVDYGFVGGWGIRTGTKYGTVYNTRGRVGLALELKNGKKFLIGTQRPDELTSFLKKAR